MVALLTCDSGTNACRYFILIDDIWSKEAWELVRSVLPSNDNGSRIIITTRNKELAKSCCNGISEHMFEARPLNEEDSQRLFFKRLFFSSEDCPQDLRKVSREILRKCSGLPLAIISIAGLLANRSQTAEVWGNTLKSISTAAEKDSHIDKMNRILLLSYFDLSPYLKSCLLYLSVFPEDYLIDCRRLILLWVAEGLIPGQDRESMEHQGRNYLNQLITRSLVQPTKFGSDGTTVKQCRVHDVILDFLVSKAVDDNFVTIWNRTGFSDNYNSHKIRRLSIQENISARAEEVVRTIKNAPHIRSITIFGNNSVLIKHASEFLTSQVLRVMNIEGHFEECFLGRVKCFGQMKYLRIMDYEGEHLSKLPEDTNNLQHLETLDVYATRIIELPASIIQFQKLVRLFVDTELQLPDAIGNLQALEELGLINLGIQSLKCIHGLGDLTKLKVLSIQLYYYSTDVHDVEDHRNACILSLSKLFMGLRELRAANIISHDAALSFMASSVRTPPPLQTLSINSIIMVPHQISWLVNLKRLIVGLNSEISKEGMDILASLPRLVSLHVFIEDFGPCPLHPMPAIIVQGFQQLVKFRFGCMIDAALEFDPGAMPKLQRLMLRLVARCQFKYGTGGLVLGLQNLAGLKHVDLHVDCDAATADEVQALEDDVRAAADAHPNRPMLKPNRISETSMAEGCSRRPTDHVDIA
ncbi:hypothetical protein HU200_011030 [Digitaria exilis]|uniref:NB-ARC domain-containing protein n=1 Tax=Digitaria exilis TaxID=1010633 RepID=A0A835FI49_9POAL|nr:hypothetical protein HU200_011030 [Digitaria exilis]